MVSAVAADALNFTGAFSYIAGANVGTTITNTVVSLALYRERKPLRRAFCAATMHDLFNILTAILVLSVENISGGFMEHLTNAVLTEDDEVVEVEHLRVLSFNAITEPAVNIIIQLDKSFDLRNMNENETNTTLKHCSEDLNCSYLFDFW